MTFHLQSTSINFHHHLFTTRAICFALCAPLWSNHNCTCHDLDLRLGLKVRKFIEETKFKNTYEMNDVDCKMDLEGRWGRGRGLQGSCAVNQDPGVFAYIVHVYESISEFPVLVFARECARA